MKNILIIGGNSDIGLSLLCEFAQNNCNLILTSKNLNNLEINKKKIEDTYKNRCDIYKFDVVNDNILDLLNKIDNNIDTLIFHEEYEILAFEDVKKLNVFSRLLKSINFLIWGDV